MSDTVGDAEATGHIVRWWQHGGHGDDEFATLRRESGGWTIEGRLAAAGVDYVIRLGPDGESRQFLLFRDLDEPDLWLAHDGRGGWGEVNGAARPDLEGCTAIGPAGTLLLLSLPIRRLGVWAATAERRSERLGIVDVETLGITVREHHYLRLGPTTWSLAGHGGAPTTAEVDEDYLLIDLPGTARRQG